MYQVRVETLFFDQSLLSWAQVKIGVVCTCVHAYPYFFNQTPRLLFILLHARFVRLLIEGGIYFFWKPWDVNDGWMRYVRVRRWQLLDAVSSTHSLSLLLSAVGATCTTQTVLELEWWPSSEIIRTRVRCCIYYPWLLFEGGIYFVQELQIVWLLFEGGVYLKKYGSRLACIFVECG